MIFKRIPSSTTDTFCLSILALSITFENSPATSFSVCVNLCRSEVIIIQRMKYPDTNVRQEMMCDVLRTRSHSSQGFEKTYKPVHTIHAATGIITPPDTQVPATSWQGGLMNFNYILRRIL